MRLLQKLLMALVLIASTTVQAHMPGEHQMGLLQGVIHFFTESTHVLPLFASLLFVGFLIYRVSRKLRSHKQVNKDSK